MIKRIASVVAASAMVWLVGCSGESAVGLSEGNTKTAVISSTLEATPPALRVAPGMVMSTQFPDNLEIVRRTTTSNPSQIEHRYWNSSLTQWSPVQATFGQQIVSDPAICALHNISGAGIANELHVVVIEQQGTINYLVHYYRKILGNNQYEWTRINNCQLENGSFISGVTGTPAMIANTNNNNLEVLVRTSATNMNHYVLTPSNANPRQTNYWRLHASFAMSSDASMCQASNGYIYACGTKGTSADYTWLQCMEIDDDAGYTWCQSGKFEGTELQAYKYKTGIANRNDGGLELFYAKSKGGATNVNVVSAVKHYPVLNTTSPSQMTGDGWVGANGYPSQISVATTNGNAIHLHFYTSAYFNKQYRVFP